MTDSSAAKPLLHLNEDNRSTGVGFFLVVSSVLTIATVLVGGLMSTGHNWGGDFAQYIAQADSIVAGEASQQIESSRQIIEKSSYEMGPYAYPWGLPLMLSPVVAWTAGVNLVALKVVGGVSFLGFLCSMAWLFRRRHSLPWLSVLLALFAVNWVVLEQTNHIGSDLPFLWFSTMALVLIQRLMERDRGWAMGVGLGVIFGFSILLRFNGILLVAALAVGQLGKLLGPALYREKSVRSLFDWRNWREVVGVSGMASYLVCLVVVAIVGFWLPAGGGNHFAVLQKVNLSTVLQNIHYYIDLPQVLLPRGRHREVLYGILFALAIGGAMRAGRRDVVTIAYFAMTCGLYVVWPTQQGIRFLLPITPLFLSWALETIERFCRSSGPAAGRRQNRMFLLIGAMIVLLLGLQSTAHLKANLQNNRYRPTGPFTEESAQMFAFVEREVSADERVVFFKPRVMQLLIDRDGVLETRTERLRLGDVVVYYLAPDAIDQVDLGYLEGRRAAGRALVIFENIDFRIYRLSY